MTGGLFCVARSCQVVFWLDAFEWTCAGLGLSLVSLAYDVVLGASCGVHGAAAADGEDCLPPEAEVFWALRLAST